LPIDDNTSKSLYGQRDGYCNIIRSWA